MELPGLFGFYGGILGKGQSSDFDFGRPFRSVDAVRLHLVGVSDLDDLPGLALIAVYLDNMLVAQTSARLELGPWIPLLPNDAFLEGSGELQVGISPATCCDHVSRVDDAALWLEASPLAARSLRGFGELQNCFSGDGMIAGECEIGDFDQDQDVDLADFRELVASMTGP